MTAKQIHTTIYVQPVRWDHVWKAGLRQFFACPHCNTYQLYAKNFLPNLI